MYERANPRSYSVATLTKNQSSYTLAVTGRTSSPQADPSPKDNRDPSFNFRTRRPLDIADRRKRVTRDLHTATGMRYVIICLSLRYRPSLRSALDLARSGGGRTIIAVVGASPPTAAPSPDQGSATPLIDVATSNPERHPSSWKP